MPDDDAYVHDPATFREEVDDRRSTASPTDRDRSDRDRTDRDRAGPETDRRPYRVPPAESFGWQGWLLVGALALAFVVVPLTLLYLPHARPVVRSFGLSFRDAYLVLPLVPALLLGALAVWSAVSARRTD